MQSITVNKALDSIKKILKTAFKYSGAPLVFRSSIVTILQKVISVLGSIYSKSTVINLKMVEKRYLKACLVGNSG